MIEKLSEQDLSELQDWVLNEGKLEKEFTFADFKKSMEFVNLVAELSESENHHPEIEIHYNKVEIELSTHSEGGVTEKDLSLAKEIEKLYEN